MSGFANASVEVRQGHVLELLRQMPEESVQCVVTSPPYWGLRSYKTEPQVWGGSPECRHEWGEPLPPHHPGQVEQTKWQHAEAAGSGQTAPSGQFCACGAWRGELGLEPTPELYVQHLVEVFKEVKRVLRSDGVMFVNMGDSFSSIEYGKIREDEQDKFFQLPLEIQLELFQLWAQHRPPSVQGNVRDLLSEILETATSLSSERILKEVLPNTQEAVPYPDSNSQQDSSPTDDSSIRRTMRLLRRKGDNFSVSRSHQGKRQTRICQKRGASRSLETGDTGRTSKGQISDSLLELQRRAWSLWAVSSLELNLTSVPRQARQLFQVTLKPKDLCGIPWRLAFALQADGWWLRSAITLCKLNPMPESCRDRPTSATEMMFLMTRSSHYYYDQEAVREPYTKPMNRGGGEKLIAKGHSTWDEGTGQHAYCDRDMRPHLSGRNLRNWWPVVSEPFKEAHFATFSQKWVEPCLRAGTSERGCCAKCGAPWERQVKKSGGTTGRSWHDHVDDAVVGQRGDPIMSDGSYRVETLGWHPTCYCYQQITPCSQKEEACRTSIGGSQDDLKAPTATPGCGSGGSGIVPCTVLDPFAGSGTVGVVALKHGRSFIGIDVKHEYCEMARRRIGEVMPLFACCQAPLAPQISPLAAPSGHA